MMNLTGSPPSVESHIMALLMNYTHACLIMESVSCCGNNRGLQVGDMEIKLLGDSIRERVPFPSTITGTPLSA